MTMSFGRWAGAILTGALMALGLGLHPFVPVLWFAFVPLLAAAFGAGRFETWALGFVAGVISLAGLVGYYLTVATPAATVGITLFTGLLMAGLASITRGVVRRSDHWLTPFVFPTLAAGFEMAISALSPHATAGSWAYSQMDWPQAIQVAALGGETAVVFLIALTSSTLAVALFRRRRIQAPVLAYGLPLLVVAGVLGFGYLRIADAPKAATVRVGLEAIDAKDELPNGSGGPDDARLSAYLDGAHALAARGASIVVMPEKIENLDDAAAVRAKAGLGVSASADHAAILAGVSLHGKDGWRNVAWLFGPDGKQYVDYDKHHMVPAFESKYRVGKTYAVITLNGAKYGVAICKDMDFPALGRAYAGVNAMLVPAWDFKVDGWLHGRMAMLRSVENGYSLIRAARNGRLTVNDRFGRVIADQPSRRQPISLLSADAPLAPGTPTVFDKGGWLFGWGCLGLTVLIILAGWLPRKKAGAGRA
jgi:apolipoprotein N-acyltransferase